VRASKGRRALVSRKGTLLGSSSHTGMRANLGALSEGSSGSSPLLEATMWGYADGAFH